MTHTMGTTYHDRYGLPLSTSSASAAERYIDGIDRVLAYEVDAERCFEAAIAADDGFALAHAALAFLLNFRGAPDIAKAAIARAGALAAGTTRRERQHVAAIAANVAADGPRATVLIREQLAEFPRDVLLLFQVNGIIGLSGRQERQQERFALLEGLAPHYGDDWAFLHLYGFAHHESDLFGESRRLSERSLALYPRSGGATHNLAHVFYETNDHGSGAGFLDGWLAGYDPRAPFHCHLSWHMALFELARGRYARVMALYDTAISPAVTQTRTSMFDASTLLWRCQLYGGGAEPLPWAAVCDRAAQMTAKPGAAFADTHAALAFAATGSDAALSRLIDALRDLDAKGHPLAGTLTLPLVQGVAAFMRRDYDETIRQIEPVLPQLVRIGGSNAQREVFEDTLLEAYLRSGRYEQAETMLRRRLDRRPSTRDYFWLGRAQLATGRQTDAMTSLQRVTDEWCDADADTAEIAAVHAARHAVST